MDFLMGGGVGIAHLMHQILFAGEVKVRKFLDLEQDAHDGGFGFCRFDRHVQFAEEHDQETMLRIDQRVANFVRFIPVNIHSSGDLAETVGEGNEGGGSFQQWADQDTQVGSRLGGRCNGQGRIQRECSLR